MATLSVSQLFTPQDVDNSAADVIFTVPSAVSSTLLRNGRVRFCNHTNAAATITAWAVPSAGTAGDGNICLPTKSIAANDYFDLDLPQIGPGGTFEAQSGTASSITVQPLDGLYYSE